MDDTHDIPLSKEIVGDIRKSQGVESAAEIENGWVRVTDNDLSLLICTDVEKRRDKGQLDRGATLLNSDDDGVLFVDPPHVVVLGTEHPRGGINILEESEGEVTTALIDRISVLFQEGLDDYPHLQVEELRNLFVALLSSGDKNYAVDIDNKSGLKYEMDLSSSHRVMEKDVANLVTKWLLRNNPEHIAKLGSSSDTVTSVLADQRDQSSRLHLVDLPVRAARVNRLMTVYRFSDVLSGHSDTISYTSLVDGSRDDEISNSSTDRMDGSGQDDSAGRFDAVFSGLIPARIHNVDKHLQDRASKFKISRRATLSTYLALEGMHQLSENGRGAFFLDFGQMTRFNILERALELGQVHSVLLFDDPHVSKDGSQSKSVAVILFKNGETPESGDIRVIEVKSQELDPHVNKLIHAQSAELRSNETAEIEGLEYRPISTEDIRELETRLVLYEPQLVPFLRADETVPLGQIVDTAHFGEKSGANDFFYFERDDVEEIEFSQRFLTPVVRRPPEDAMFNLTRNQATHYALDLREYIDSLEDRNVTISEESVLKSLQDDGHDELIDYISNHQELADRAMLQHLEIWFCPFRRQRRSTDSLLFGRYSDGTWYRLENEKIIVSEHWYVFECDSEIVDSLHRLLNSEPYQNLLTYFGTRNQQFYSISLDDLKSLPVPIGILENGLEDHPFPPSRRREQRRLDEAVVERCCSPAASHAIESLLEPDDRFTWAWFLSPSEYEEFKRIYEDDEEQAKEYIADRFDEGELREILNHIAAGSFNTERWEIIEELSEEYQQQNYRLFMYGVTPQFEGMIMDWARENGHSVIWKGNRPYIEITSEDKSDELEPIPKSLGALINEFLPRGFGDFLQDEIKEFRDNLAHGEVIEESREQATICFLSLHALAHHISKGNLHN